MVSAPKPDPEVKRQRQAARADKQESIQDRVSSLTDALVRQFGARNALAGTSLGSPLSGKKR